MGECKNEKQTENEIEDRLANLKGIDPSKLAEIVLLNSPCMLYLPFNAADFKQA